MRAFEQAGFTRGLEPADLMESAGAAIAAAVQDFFPEAARTVVFAGKGHNAGDVFVAARHLALAGWTVELDLAFPESSLAPLAARKLAELRAIPVLSANLRPNSTVVLDGLLGIGAQGDPRDPVAAAILRIRDFRANGAFVVAADLPSGLDADTGQPGDPCVVADLTVAVGFAKAGLLADASTNHVGRLAVARLPELSPFFDAPTDSAEVITAERLRPLLPPRPFDSHKGTWGRVGIIAGSPGMLGAARLCAEGALRAGAGLVTLYALPNCYTLLAATMPPEIMVVPVTTYAAALSARLDAIAIGPGLGANPDGVIRDIVTRFTGSMVVDADALNLLARHPYAWRNLAGPRLFTPHPGEMARLSIGSQNLSRRALAEQYVSRHKVTLLLKGARTLVAEWNQPTAFNSTGNPGMGTGGMGDVLTGVCAAFLAQGRSPREAAMLGAWICGRAAERFVFSPGGSPESLVASEVIHRLGEAFRELRG